MAFPIIIFPGTNGPPFAYAGDVRAEGALRLRLQAQSFHHLALDRHLKQYVSVRAHVVSYSPYALRHKAGHAGFGSMNIMQIHRGGLRNVGLPATFVDGNN